MSLADEIALAGAGHTLPDESSYTYQIRGTSADEDAPKSLADQIGAAGTAVLKRTMPAEQQQQYNPTGSDFENYAAGTGRGVANVIRGTGQVLRSGLSYLPNGDAMSDKMGLTTTADVDEANRLDAPLMKTKAGIAGDITGNIATTLLPFGVAAKTLGVAAKLGAPVSKGIGLASMLANPTTYAASAASGVLNGAIEPTGTGDDRAHNMFIGGLAGLAGNGIANGIGRIAQPIQNTLSTAAQKSLQVLKDAGIPIDTAQASGSALLNGIKSGFTDNPFTSGVQNAAAAVQGTAFNRAALQHIGEDAPAATKEVMGAADTRIGNVFSDVLDRNNIHINDSHVAQLGVLQQSALDNEKAPVSNLINRLMGFIKGDDTVSGQNIYNIKKQLDTLSSSADSTMAHEARGVRSMVMNTIHESLNPADQAAFSEARQQFRNMKLLEPAISKEGAGDISAATLANTFSQKANRGASIYGRGDQSLVDLAQSGKQILGDKTPNSGTTKRALMQMSMPLLAGGIAGGSATYNGDYESGATRAALAAAGMVVLPKAAQYIINRPGANSYLAQGVQNTMLRDMLQSPQNQDLVGGAIRRLPGASISAK